MFSHDATLVHVAFHSAQPSFAGVLPDDVVASVGQFRLFVAIHGNHERISFESALQVLVVEVAVGVDEGLLMVGLLHQVKHLRQRVAELLGGHPGIVLHVEHGDEVLLGRQTLRLEVVYLQTQVHLWPEEMIERFKEKGIEFL